jgi:hypothetical protein
MGKSCIAGVSKSPVPEIAGHGESQMVSFAAVAMEGIQTAHAIRAHKKSPGSQVLHRETKWIKLHRNKIITGEFAGANEVFDNVRRDKDIVEVEWM